MIYHMALIRFRKELKAKDVEAAMQAIGALDKKIPGITGYKFGPYSSPEGLNKGFNWGFCMTFTDAKARDVYLAHPEHDKVKEKVFPLLDGGLDGITVFDFQA